MLTACGITHRHCCLPKFHDNLSGGSRGVACGRKVGHDDGNSRFSQFYEGPYKISNSTNWACHYRCKLSTVWQFAVTSYSLRTVNTNVCTLKLSGIYCKYLFSMEQDKKVAHCFLKGIKL